MIVGSDQVVVYSEHMFCQFALCGSVLLSVGLGIRGDQGKL